MFKLKCILIRNKIIFEKNSRLSISTTPQSAMNLQTNNNSICGYQPVADFYAGRSMFITGGTGFLGKALIEKLLYSCPQLDKIYVLMRETKELDATQRLQKMLDNPVFSRLKNERIQDLNKIVPIGGNIVTPELGISHTDKAMLTEKVSVVVHSAAITSFNKPLKEAFETNYEGTRRVLNLSKCMKNIKAFIHVSTAYTNTDKCIIDEVVYPPPADINEVYRFLESNSTDKNKLRKIMNGRINTYTFTKALTEQLVADSSRYMPTVIIRPSMVCPTKDEPFKGWMDNLSIPTQLLTFGARGFNRVIAGTRSSIVDFVPIDYVVNLIIVAAARYKRSNQVAVYNSCTGSVNPIYLEQTFKYFNDARVKFNSDDLPFPRVFIAKSDVLIATITFLTQIVPAYIFDFILLLKGERTKYVKIQRHFLPVRESNKYFTLTSWLLKTDKTQQLYGNLSTSDKRDFPFDFADITWPEYMALYAKATKKLLLQKKKLIEENRDENVKGVL